MSVELLSTVINNNNEKTLLETRNNFQFFWTCRTHPCDFALHTGHCVYEFTSHQFFVFLLLFLGFHHKKNVVQNKTINLVCVGANFSSRRQARRNNTKYSTSISVQINFVVITFSLLRSKPRQSRTLHATKSESHTKLATTMSARSGSDSDDSSLFGSPSVQSSEPDKKRRRLNENQTDSGKRESKANVQGTAISSTTSNQKSGSNSTVDPVLLAHAKSRLSKFAARLFDPNRIKVCA